MKQKVPEYLYHVTKKRNISSILRTGLKPEFRKGIPGGRRIPDVVELDSDAGRMLEFAQEEYPNDYKVLSINTSKIDKRKLKKSNFYTVHSGGRKEFSTWFTYRDKIPPEAIRSL